MGFLRHENGSHTLVEDASIVGAKLLVVVPFGLLCRGWTPWSVGKGTLKRGEERRFHRY